MAPARVAPMQQGSLDEIVRAEGEIYEFPWTRGNFADSMAAGYDCFELRAGAPLIGYAVMMFSPGEAHLLNLSIISAMQRQGYGAAFLRVLIECARARGAVRMLLEVRPSNDAARRLYGRAGFAGAGVRRSYYPARHGREDALMLALDL